MFCSTLLKNAYDNAFNLFELHILMSLLHGCSILVEQTLVELLVVLSTLQAMIMMLRLMNMVGAS